MYFWYFPCSNRSEYEGPISLFAWFKNGKLIVKQNIIKRQDNEYYKEYLTLILDHSDTIPGDWNLADAEVIIKRGRTLQSIFKEFWMDLIHSNNFKDFMKAFKDVFDDADVMKCRLDSAHAPLLSFFHRIDDFRIPEVYQELLRNDYSKDTLTLTRDLAKDHPHDPYLDLLRVDLESLCGNPPSSSQLLDQWEKEYPTHPDSILQGSLRIVRRNISNSQIMKTPKSLPMDYNTIIGSGLSFDQKISSVRDLFYVPDIPYFPMARPLILPIDSGNFKYPEPRHLIEIQMYAKSCKILALFDLFKGRFKETLDILGSLYRLGQSESSHGILVDRIIGLDSLLAIAFDGLKIFILNACVSPEDFQETWGVIQKLKNTPLQETGQYLLEGEYPLLLCMMEISGKGAPRMSDIEEIKTRYCVSDINLQLLRMVVAAKYRLATDGKFPSSEDEFSPFLPDGPPEDSFANGKPLRFIQPSDNEFVVYSIGPDKLDDKAKLAYDPSNGAISSGDIFIRIPREREYPFPKEGVKARNAYELLEQFPNGLPGDIFTFTDNTFRPLSIIESTDTKPLVIFSFGPDMNDKEFTQYVPGKTESEYMTYQPIPTPDVPPNASLGRSLQWVMRNGDGIPPIVLKTESPFGAGIVERPLSGYWNIFPYDPTNGTFSPGDLFIEIPR